MNVNPRRYWIVFLLLAVACGREKPATSYAAAGVIAFSKIQGTTYVLLADHHDSDRGWGTFGGHREEGESVAMAASREFREETRCIYGRPDAGDLDRAPTVSQRNYLTYVFEVPFVPSQVFESKPLPDECRGAEFLERGPYAWVPLDEVTRAIVSGTQSGTYTLSRAFVPASSSTLTLWDESATILLKAIEAGYLQ